MKNKFHTFIVIVSLFSSVSLLAQAPQTPPMNFPLSTQSYDCTSPVAISADDFPLAAFTFYGMSRDELCLWKQARLNFFFSDFCSYFKNNTSHTVDLCRLNNFCSFAPPCASPVAPFLTGGMKVVNSFGLGSRGNYTNLTWWNGWPNMSLQDPPASSSELLLYQHQILPGRIFNANDPNETQQENSEMRFFLASNFDYLNDDGSFPDVRKNKTFAYDLLFNWDNKIGSPTKSSGQNTYEWHITNNQNLLDGNYILKNHQAFNVWRFTPKIYCDFIYRIDATPSIGDWDNRRFGDINTPLYVVEYYLQYTDEDGNLKWSTVPNDATDDITFNKSQNPVYPANEGKDIKSFPNAAKFVPGQAGNISAHPYAVQRKVINYIIDTVTHLISGHNHQIFYNINKIECKVKAYTVAGDNRPNVGIFIRGMRQRTDLAEKLFSGSLDADLNTVFDNKRKILQKADNGLLGNSRVTAWDNTSIFSDGGEPTLQSFRIYAYLDNLCYSRIRKHIIPFIANNTPDVCRPEWYRAAYEEQTGKIPPPISMEDLEGFDAPRGSKDWQTYKDNAFVVPADATSYKVKLAGISPVNGLPVESLKNPW